MKPEQEYRLDPSKRRKMTMKNWKDKEIKNEKQNNRKVKPNMAAREKERKAESLPSSRDNDHFGYSILLGS